MNNFEKWMLKKKNIWIHIFLTLVTWYVYLIIYIIVRIKNKNYYDMIHNPELYADKCNLRCIHSKVVGVTFDNEDGTSRQKNISKVKQCDELELIPYEYQHREEALGVFHNKRQIGNISADLCYELMEIIKNDELISVIANPTGGNGKTLGCNLTIVVKK